MFEKLMALAKQGDFTIAVRIAATNAQELTLIVAPMLKEGQEPALGQPIRLTGTPAELEENFGTAMERFVGVRGSLLEQLEATEAILKDAASKSAKKGSDALKANSKAATATKVTTPAATSAPTGSAASEGDGFHDDDGDGSGLTPGAAPGAQPTAIVGTENLFGRRERGGAARTARSAHADNHCRWGRAANDFSGTVPAGS
jgi:PRTRC genetic system protein E